MDKPKNHELGRLLKQWRSVRARSQLELSFDTGKIGRASCRERV